MLSSLSFKSKAVWFLPNLLQLHPHKDLMAPPGISRTTPPRDVIGHQASRVSVKSARPRQGLADPQTQGESREKRFFTRKMQCLDYLLFTRRPDSGPSALAVISQDFSHPPPNLAYGHRRCRPPSAYCFVRLGKYWPTCLPGK